MNSILKYFLLFFAQIRFSVIGDEGGGSTQTEEEFRGTMTQGVKAIQESTKKTADKVAVVETQQQTLLKNYDQLDKDTKKAMEDLTKVKNEQNNLSDVEKALKKLQIQIGREQRMAFGDPIQRLLSNPDHVVKLNAICRKVFGLAMTEAQTKALGEDASPGSTLINDDLAQEIYHTLESFGKWATLGVRRLGTKITKFPISTARPIANFLLTEGDPIADDGNKAGSQIQIEPEIVAVLLLISKQLLDDAEFDVARDVINDFVEAWNYRVDFACFQGDGTEDATNGGITGIFNGGTAAVATAGRLTIGATKLDDWIKAQTSVDPGVLQRMNKWWMHQFNLVRSLGVTDSNGRSIFLTAIEAPSPGALGSILGSPVELVAAAPSANAANAKIAAFGDPQSYVVGVRQDFTVEQSDDYKFNTLQRAYRAYGRVDAKFRRSQGMSVLTLPAI